MKGCKNNYDNDSNNNNGSLSFKFNLKYNYKPLSYIGSLKLASLAYGLQYKTNEMGKMTKYVLIYMKMIQSIE